MRGDVFLYLNGRYEYVRCALKTACLSFTISKLLLYRLVFLIIVYCMWNVLSNCMPIFYDLLALLYLGRLASHTTARRQPCSP